MCEKPSFKKLCDFCAAVNLSVLGVCWLGTWLPALDSGEGFSIKRQIFPAQQSLWYQTRSRGPAGGSIWVTGAACHSSCGSTHKYNAACAHIGVSCAFSTCVSSLWFKLEPLAQQVHLDTSGERVRNTFAAEWQCPDFLSNIFGCQPLRWWFFLFPIAEEALEKYLLHLLSFA